MNAPGVVRTILILILLSSISCRAGKTKSQDPPKSYRQTFWDSLPKPTGYVNDYEDIYSKSEEVELENLIIDFEKRTTVEIALVTFDTTMTSADSLEAITLRIGNVWGVGKKENNNGIVIGICKGYRKMRIQNGYGIEKILSDEETKKIVDEAFIPEFARGEFYKGTLSGLNLLMTTVQKNMKDKAK